LLGQYYRDYRVGYGNAVRYRCVEHMCNRPSA
jgi:hypothetical protein